MTLVAERVPQTALPAGSFDLTPEAGRALGAFRGRCTMVRLETLDNETLGLPRWSTLDEAWCEPGSRAAAAWSVNPVVTVGAGDDPHLVLATGTPVVILGADIHRSAWSRRVVDAVRASCRTVLVVDMGAHPGADYADIATRGHDRLRGGALLALLSEPS